MKLIEKDEKVAEKEYQKAEVKKQEKERHDEAMKAFKESLAYKYVLEYFQSAEKRIIDELEQMQIRDMKEIFMLPPAEQKSRLIKMSKRDAILSGVLSIIKQVKNRL